MVTRATSTGLVAITLPAPGPRRHYKIFDVIGYLTGAGTDTNIRATYSFGLNSDFNDALDGFPAGKPRSMKLHSFGGIPSKENTVISVTIDSSPAADYPVCRLALTYEIHIIGNNDISVEPMLSGTSTANMPI